MDKAKQAKALSVNEHLLLACNDIAAQQMKQLKRDQAWAMYVSQVTAQSDPNFAKSRSSEAMSEVYETAFGNPLLH